MHAVLTVFMNVLALATATANARDVTAESEWDTIKLADKTVLEAAMKRSEEGASPMELDRLPLPAFVYFHTIDRALSFRSAWTSQSAVFPRNEKAIQTLQFFAFDGASLYYLEWACKTGRETNVAKEFVDLVPKVVTTYPEKLLLKRFTQERDRIGYNLERRCKLDELAKLRLSYQKLRNEAHILSSGTDKQGAN